MNLVQPVVDSGVLMARMKSPRQDIRAAAAQFVADALVAPALSTLHQSPMRPKSGPFAASSLEKRFAPLLEAQLADRMTTAANFRLIDTIADRFDRQSAAHTHGDKT
jgi:hypothetical protein